jgi:GGDEF domain-containing protein
VTVPETAGDVEEAEIASLSLAIGDDLTGLSNRRGFEMLGESLIVAVLIGAAASAAPALLDRVQEQVADRNRASAEPWELSLGLGIAEAPAGTEIALWDLVAQADAGMIAAKRAKKAGRDGAAARRPNSIPRRNPT